MTTMLDLEPPARELKTVLDGITDDQLSAGTPCEGTSVAAMLDHFMMLTVAFTGAARKSTEAGQGQPPEPSAEDLDPAWRQKLPQQLDALVAAWRDPAAWEGTAQAGGVTMPAEMMGVVAVDELVLHGWDLARATGQPFDVDPASTEAVFGFTCEMSKPEHKASREGLYGPVVDVPEDSPTFQRALGLSGRDPAWSPH